VTGINSWAAANLGLLVIVLGVMTLAALLLAASLALQLRQAQRHYAALTEGTDGGNLDEVLEAHAQAVRTATERVEDLARRTDRMEAASLTHLQRFGFLRFNPFRDAGGDQSFALAAADLHGNGVVISSLHGRDGTRIYGKPLVAWSSAYPLTDEERQAIEKAKAPETSGAAQRR
jgi:hypothetical protein